MSAPPEDDAHEAIAELEAAIARLRSVDAATGPGELSAHLQRMRDTALVSGDRPMLVRPGPLSGVKRTFKSAIRRSTRWYVEGLAHEVRGFQVAALDAATASSERADVMEGRIGELEQREACIGELERSIAALTERVVRAERAARSARPATPADTVSAAEPAPAAAAPAPAADTFDYFGFELTGRGTPEEIRERQRQYVRLFEGQDPVLDVGCGRGEFLSLLSEQGLTASGVDTNADMVAHCRDAGLDVVHGDGIAHLATLDQHSLGGIFAAQVVEHLAPARLMSFLEAAAQALREDGRIVLETINPASLVALRNYFADLTHEQPLVPETLAFLVESTGFRDVEIRYTSAVADEARLEHLTGEDLPQPLLAGLNRNVDRLNGLLYAPQDYAVIARA